MYSNRATIRDLRTVPACWHVIFSPDSQRFVTRPPGNANRVWNANRPADRSTALTTGDSGCSLPPDRTSRPTVSPVIMPRTCLSIRYGRPGCRASRSYWARLNETDSPDGRRLVTVGDDDHGPYLGRCLGRSVFAPTACVIFRLLRTVSPEPKGYNVPHPGPPRSEKMPGAGKFPQGKFRKWIETAKISRERVKGP